MDSLGSLSAFVHAAEARNFTTAGRKLGISASAVGKSVARMEERLGIRLFHRSTRSITLTSEGALFLERCRRILAELEAAELELAHSHETPRGRLRVSLPLVGMLLMPAVSAFVRAYPEIDLDLDFTDRLVNVIEEGFDAVIRTGDNADSRLMARQLGSSPYKLVGAPDYFARRGKPVTIADLKAHGCLRHRYPSSGAIETWPLGGKGRGMNGQLPTTIIASALEPLIFMAEQGQGLVCLPEFAVRRQLEAGSLEAVLQEDIEHSVVFRVLWPSNRHLSPKLRAFVEFMAAHLFSR